MVVPTGFCAKFEVEWSAKDCTESGPEDSENACRDAAKAMEKALDKIAASAAKKHGVKVKHKVTLISGFPL